MYWSTSPDPTLENSHTTDGDGVDRFVSRLSGLSSSTTYYVRAYATNEAGTAYGDDLTFKTLSDSDAILFYPIIFNPNLTYGTDTDADWNVYKTIKIGTQIWMAENLRTTHFCNGAQIANITDSTVWANYSLDAYCLYNNDTVNITVYGALYNWYAVNTGNLCPMGWHVPSQNEWKILASFLGGKDVAGSKLKEAGTTHWLSPNTEATNESGFTALPGGYRGTFGSFLSIRTQVGWWSSTPYSINIDSALSRGLKYNSSKFWGEDSEIGEASVKHLGLSVRCLKD